jgi:hypothetical protein
MNKPFNLYEALNGKPVVNGYGKSITGIVYIPEGATYKVVGVDRGVIITYTESGVFNPYDPLSKANLFMETTKREGFVNVWRNEEPGGVIHATVHISLAQAEAERVTSCSGKAKTLVARLPFTWDE